MDIKSEPVYEDEQVTDLDVHFASGNVLQLTLHTEKGDTLVEGEAGSTAIVVDLVQPPENYMIFKPYVEYIRTQLRVIRRILPTPRAQEHTQSPPAPPETSQ